MVERLDANLCACFVAGDSTGDAVVGTGLPLDMGPVRVVHVERRAEIEAVRSGLPITGMEQEVMEALPHNDVVVLCGETGCGKTTQVCYSCHIAYPAPAKLLLVLSSCYANSCPPVASLACCNLTVAHCKHDYIFLLSCLVCLFHTPKLYVRSTSNLYCESCSLLPSKVICCTLVIWCILVSVTACLLSNAGASIPV